MMSTLTRGFIVREEMPSVTYELLYATSLDAKLALAAAFRSVISLFSISPSSRRFYERREALRRATNTAMSRATIFIEALGAFL